MLRYLGGIGLTVPDREEVIQETFLSLFQHLRAGKPRANLRGWLFRVAHYLALKEKYHLRHRTEQPVESSKDCNGPVDPGPNPEEQCLMLVTQRRLLAVVDALPPQDRQCLFLRAEGLRYREIAEILDMSLGAVSLSLGRSMARIASAAER